MENLSWRVKLTCLSADFVLNKMTPDPICARRKLSCWANSQGIVERCWQAALAPPISPLLRSSLCRQNCSETVASGNATECRASSRIVEGQRNSLTPGRSDFSCSDGVMTKEYQSQTSRSPQGLLYEGGWRAIMVAQVIKITSWLLWRGPGSLTRPILSCPRHLVSPTVWQQFFLHPWAHTRPCHDLLGGISLPRQVF